MTNQGIKRLALILVVSSVCCCIPASAQNQRLHEPQNRAARKLQKKQQKAQKKAAKAQRKAERKMQKYDRKHTHDPNLPKRH